MRTLGPTFWVAAAAATIGVAGCSRGNQPVDDALMRDLAAVRAAPPAQFDISPSEAGLTPSPKAPTRSTQPTRRPAKQVAVAHTPPRAPAPAPKAAPRAVVVEAPSTPARTESIDAPPAPRPASAPARAEEPHRGPYKTEAEIFRQMPWIRP